MFEIVLYQPEIPPNTGNIMRLAANTGVRLHLIEPLGFVLSDRRLRRAGLDYEDKARTMVHASLSDCEQTLTRYRPYPSQGANPGMGRFAGANHGARFPDPTPANCTDTPAQQRREERRWFAVSTRGTRVYSDVRYRPGDVLLFGPETRGLPEAVLKTFLSEHIVRLPMLASSRSLNLANAVAAVVYEAWRQCGFGQAGAGSTGSVEARAARPRVSGRGGYDHSHE